MAIASGAAPVAARIVGVTDAVGTLWINAIRMTVIPLVVGSLITGVAAAPSGSALGRQGVRAATIFAALVVVGATVAALVGPFLFAKLPLAPGAVEALRASAANSAQQVTTSASQVPTAVQWLISLVPVNPVKAAADGAMLPLIVFTLFFAVASTKLPVEAKAVLHQFFAGVTEAAMVLVRWVLALAPLGVCALSVSLAAKLGASAAGALAGYVAVTAVVTSIVSLVVLYPLASLGGRVSLTTFARGAFPAQAVAVSARSSLAALPAMMESATTKLNVPQHVSAFFLPLAASTFRFGGSIGMTLGVLFLARLYGVDLGPTQLASVVAVVCVTTFSVPGIPAGSIVALVPALLAGGIPVEGLGVLLAVDTVPDMFRTTSNVTGDLAAAVLMNEERA